VFDFRPWKNSVVALAESVSASRLFILLALAFVLFATAVAFLMAIRSFSLMYGKRLWLGALGAALYSIALAFAVATGRLGAVTIAVTFWIIAAAVPVATVFAFAKALADRLLTVRQSFVAAAVWIVVAVAYLSSLLDIDAGTGGVAPALAALAFASSLLPLTAVALVPWSMDQVRHA
jgi:hypothetical protein